MTEKNDGLQERQLSLAVRKAFRQLLKDIESEPTVVIESNDSTDGVSGKTIDDVHAWLFKGRSANGYSNSRSYKYRTNE